MVIEGHCSVKCSNHCDRHEIIGVYQETSFGVSSLMMQEDTTTAVVFSTSNKYILYAEGSCCNGLNKLDIFILHFILLIGTWPSKIQNSFYFWNSTRPICVATFA